MFIFKCFSTYILEFIMTNIESGKISKKVPIVLVGKLKEYSEKQQTSKFLCLPLLKIG